MTTFADRMPPVRADAEQLLQVFLNLSLNAIQAMPGGRPGKLFISTALRRATRRGATAAFLEVRFRDTGVGIPPAISRTSSFRSSPPRRRGPASGLPISQRIIENHGGTIEVRSQPGEGATFTVLLPIEADAYAAYLEATREAAAPRRRPRRPRFPPTGRPAARAEPPPQRARPAVAPRPPPVPPRTR